VHRSGLENSPQHVRHGIRPLQSRVQARGLFVDDRGAMQFTRPAMWPRNEIPYDYHRVYPARVTGKAVRNDEFVTEATISGTAVALNLKCLI